MGADELNDSFPDFWRICMAYYAGKRAEYGVHWAAKITEYSHYHKLTSIKCSHTELSWQILRCRKRNAWLKKQILIADSECKIFIWAVIHQIQNRPCAISVYLKKMLFNRMWLFYLIAFGKHICFVFHIAGESKI